MSAAGRQDGDDNGVCTCHTRGRHPHESMEQWKRERRQRLCTCVGVVLLMTALGAFLIDILLGIATVKNADAPPPQVVPVNIT